MIMRMQYIKQRKQQRNFLGINNNDCSIHSQKTLATQDLLERHEALLVARGVGWGGLGGSRRLDMPQPNFRTNRSSSNELWIQETQARFSVCKFEEISLSKLGAFGRGQFVLAPLPLCKTLLLAKLQSFQLFSSFFQCSSFRIESLACSSALFYCHRLFIVTDIILWFLFLIIFTFNVFTVNEKGQEVISNDLTKVGLLLWQGLISISTKLIHRLPPMMSEFMSIRFSLPQRFIIRKIFFLVRN